MGGGLALRARDAEARVTLVSAEHDHFFSRPALMYVLPARRASATREPYDRRFDERLRFERGADG
jgi:hypothetical protein